MVSALKQDLSFFPLKNSRQGVWSLFCRVRVWHLAGSCQAGVRLPGWSQTAGLESSDSGAAFWTLTASSVKRAWSQCLLPRDVGTRGVLETPDPVPGTSVFNWHQSR